MLYSLGTLGYLFIFGSFFSRIGNEQSDSYGLYTLATLLFIGSALLVIQYFFLRQLALKERLIELVCVISADILAFNFQNEDVLAFKVIIFITAIGCLLVNRKKVEKVFSLNHA
ncbi:hypothetical protein P6P90_16095 [Ectobacillus antri]|jgi:intracellular septation protein A|uniref:EamA domain-containing protein n=1 Tax=Ectobacillus antri TaxID=2486280 RepID=A0ABT6H974_9BACI|nr:hypothetical protein [Ectobacillus antri]MDG4658440.1 hypothetical protein [Ectobacillus antri]MDG5755423.1 hypothetical protein [Ectobacillus antri]